jgi:hypothetical protein
MESILSIKVNISICYSDTRSINMLFYDCISNEYKISKFYFFLISEVLWQIWYWLALNCEVYIACIAHLDAIINAFRSRWKEFYPLKSIFRCIPCLSAWHNSLSSATDLLLAERCQTLAIHSLSTSLGRYGSLRPPLEIFMFPQTWPNI